MYSPTSTFRIALIAAAMALSWATMAPAAKGPRMDPVSGSGATSAMSAYEFSGDGQISIRKTVYDLTVYTVVMGVQSMSDGTLHVHTSHTLQFGTWTIVTDDKAVADPTDTPGLYILNSNMEVISGGRGRIHAHGFINLFLGQTSFELRGAVELAE